MKSTVLKLAGTAALVVCATAALSGCIMYVAPDHTYHHDNSPPPADEKPAAVLSSSQSF